MLTEAYGYAHLITRMHMRTHTHPHKNTFITNDADGRMREKRKMANQNAEADKSHVVLNLAADW